MTTGPRRRASAPANLRASLPSGSATASHSGSHAVRALRLAGTAATDTSVQDTLDVEVADHDRIAGTRVMGARPPKAARVISPLEWRPPKAAIATGESSAAEVRERPYLRIAEAASLAGVSPKRMQNLMAAGVLTEGVHFTRPRGLGPRFKRAALLEWLDGGEGRQGDAIPMARQRH